MGKSKKSNKIVANFRSTQGLEEQITEGRVAKTKNKKEKIRMRYEDEDSEFVDPKTTQRILKAAQKHRAELASEFGPTPSEAKSRGLYKTKKAFTKDSDESDEGEQFDDDEKEEYTEHDFFDDLKINDEDEKALEMFQNKDGAKTRTLADIIMEKIAERKTEIQTQFSDNGSMAMDDLDPRVKEMYEGVRDVMKRYRSGKVPKAFKIIPRLKNWEQILFLTEPHNWSSAAMYEGTKMFVSGLKESMTQRFYNLVLLPRIRDDLAEFNKLNCYLYRALRKALFRPAAFFKGIILPLLEAGDCTLREAIIFGSILSKTSIPVLQASACLLKICEMEYSGANSILIRILLEKRYALPYRVVDGAVFHFLRFENDHRDLPTLWHQALLAFVQRYKNDISSEQRDALLQLLRKKNHAKITPDIRRELQAAKPRDVELGAPMQCEENESEDDDDMDME
ncbi:hypothetical protein PVAND_010867 [Polypedilum vanderplanki]|uniref:Bystin n=1 Tax=Polypedilum vanderplanki TaxID=319348 RepID=A0A9J6CIN7_POLVA|nr:hypothetical protein PVAND_010867 [Polypedilum vanderplanki]